MKFLICGLDSMGKRRIRCLQKLGYTDIVGYDINKERLEKAKEIYNVYSV